MTANLRGFAKIRGLILQKCDKSVWPGNYAVITKIMRTASSLSNEMPPRRGSKFCRFFFYKYFAPTELGLELLVVLTLLALTATIHAATSNDLTGLLQQGLFEEEADRNLDAAISNYQTLANAFDKDREVAATAIFRLGECYRKLGRTNEAAAQYERIVRDFGDQQTLVTLSRQNLAGLGVGNNDAFTPQNTISTTASDTLQELQTALVKEKTEYDRKNATLSTLKKLSPEELRKALPTVVPDNQLDSLLSELNLAEQKLLQVKADYAPEHPKYQAAKEQVDTLQQKVNGRIEGILTGLQAELDANQAHQQWLENEIQKAGAPMVAQSASEQAPITDDEEKEIRRIQELIKNSPDLINSTGGGNGKTPLFQAARAGWMRVAAFLLAHGADPNVDSGQLGKPLLAAAQSGNKAIVELLLDHGADVNAPAPSTGFIPGCTALHIAVDKGFLAVAETLLDHKADVNARDNDGQTPLHLAAASGQPEMMKVLLAHGADVNAKDKNDATPLHIAASDGYVEIVKTLLAHGADVNAKDIDGATPLRDAAFPGHIDCVKALLDAKANPNGGTANLPLAGAIENDSSISSNICELLLGSGADPNRAAPENAIRIPGYGTYSSRKPVSPIDLAVLSVQPDIVELLLNYKADPNTQGFWEKTPLLSAIVRSKNVEIAQALLAHGADANARDNDNKTPLNLAVARGESNVVESLLAYGADVNARDPSGETALTLAVNSGNLEMTELLLSNKADANVSVARQGGSQGIAKMPLLMEAVAEDNTEIARDIAQALVAHGANVNARDSAGETALFYPVRRGDLEMAKLLLSNKAEVNVQNKDGKTPLDYAKEQQGSGQPGMLNFAQRVRGLQRTSGSPQNTTQASSEIVTLLRQHGALDELPDFNAIRVTREGFPGPAVVFERQSNDWNHYTLLETVGHLYSEQTLQIGNAGYDWPTTSLLKFPDLTRIIIHRPDRAAVGKQKDNTVNLLNGTNGIDCARDVPLEFGDMVEIPFRDYSLSEQAVGLTKSQEDSITACLARKVRLIVRGESRELRPNPAWCFLGNTLQMPEAQSMLLASSDLSQVKVTREDPATGKTREFVVDAAQSPQDLWLENGDTIHVPDKQGE